MKRYVVLADKIIAPGPLISVPEIVPSVSISGDFLRPLLRRRKVADDRLDPYVDTFVLEPFDRYGDSPFYIAGDGPVPKSFFQVTLGKAVHIGAPDDFLLFRPFLKPFLEGAQFQEEMLRVPWNGGSPAGAAVRLDEVRDV